MMEQEMFEEILRSEVIEVKCNNCGEDTVMNIAYQKYVKDGLLKCGKCRSKER